MNVRIITLFFSLVIAAAAQQVEIKSLHWSADEKAGVTVFTGNVIITRNQDKMWADKVVVTADANQEVDRFDAEGNTAFELYLEDNRTFKGHSERFVYEPQKKLFTLTGNAMVEDVTNERKIYGEEIVLNEITKKAEVSGEVQKPVKVIFKLKEDNASADR